MSGVVFASFLHSLLQFSGLVLLSSLMCFTCMSNYLLPPHRRKPFGSSVSFIPLVSSH